MSIRHQSNQPRHRAPRNSPVSNRKHPNRQRQPGPEAPDTAHKPRKPQPVLIKPHMDDHNSI